MGPGSSRKIGGFLYRFHPGMSRRRWGSLFWALARFWVGGFFAYAGFMKLMEPTANFQASLEQYALLPDFLIPFLARAIPWLEWLGGMFLIVGYFTRGAALVLAVLSLGFLAVLSGPVWLGQGLKECGCFGKTGLTLTQNQVYLLDGVNFLLAGFLSLRKRHPLALDNRFYGGRL